MTFWALHLKKDRFRFLSCYSGTMKVFVEKGEKKSSQGWALGGLADVCRGERIGENGNLQCARLVLGEGVWGGGSKRV